VFRNERIIILHKKTCIIDKIIFFCKITLYREKKLYKNYNNIGENIYNGPMEDFVLFILFNNSKKFFDFILSEIIIFCIIIIFMFEGNLGRRS